MKWVIKRRLNSESVRRRKCNISTFEEYMTFFSFLFFSCIYLSSMTIVLILCDVSTSLRPRFEFWLGTKSKLSRLSLPLRYGTVMNS